MRALPAFGRKSFDKKRRRFALRFSFWANRGEVEATEPGYLAFHHFDGTHIALLAVAAAIITCAVLIFRRLSTAGKNRFFTVLTVLMLFDELAKYAIAIGTDDWYWGYLPLHLCSINIFVCLAYTLTKKDFFAEILYCLCLPGAGIALLVPTWNDLPILNGMHLHSASVHIMLVMYPVLVLANGFKPNYRRLPKILGLLAVVAVPIYFINRWLGTNFLFLARTDNNPVLEMLAAVFGKKYFFLGLPVLLIVAWALMYLPWIISEHKKAKI